MSMNKPDDNPYVEPPVEAEFADPDGMTKDEAREQVDLLREAVEYHDRRYYVENDPVVSDKTYDRLYERLESLEDVSDSVTKTPRRDASEANRSTNWRRANTSSRC